MKGKCRCVAGVGYKEVPKMTEKIVNELLRLLSTNITKLAGYRKRIKLEKICTVMLEKYNSLPFTHSSTHRGGKKAAMHTR